MRIGLISDTHGYWDPRIPDFLGGVELILHAGDIGSESIILELERLAPVTAVLGNTDVDLPYRETEAIELGPLRILLHHIVDPRQPDELLRGWLLRGWVNIVVYGHTHKPLAEMRDSVLYVNPGYTGRPRFHMPRSLATLEVSGGFPQVTFHSLGGALPV